MRRDVTDLVRLCVGLGDWPRWSVCGDVFSLINDRCFKVELKSKVRYGTE